MLRRQRMSNDTAQQFYVAFAATQSRLYTPTLSDMLESAMQKLAVIWLVHV